MDSSSSKVDGGGISYCSWGKLGTLIRGARILKDSSCVARLFAADPRGARGLEAVVCFGAGGGLRSPAT
jgi:hypothetical protein